MICKIDTLLKAWRATTKAVAHAPAEFVGKDKETRVFGRLRQEIEKLDPRLALYGPDSQLRFNRWAIDLVCVAGDCCIAIEGKYKTISDGAVPENRKAAFFDLFKLEQYVASGKHDAGLFLWLTDEPSYRRQATGDSADFSTYHTRVYEPGTPLRAVRARSAMPLTLVLNGDFKFQWDQVNAVGGWYALEIRVTQPNRVL